MSNDHYYSMHPSSETNPKEIAWTFNHETFRFLTDTGVFSKKGIDFGSHLLLEQIIQYGCQGSVLDLGCGYGPIGAILSQQCPQTSVVLVDINVRAVNLAKENLFRANISNARVLLSDGFNALKTMKFDFILSNPPIRAGKKLIHNWFEEAYQHLNMNGELWIVIQKKQGANSAFEKLISIFSEVNKIEQKKGYWIIQAIKQS